MKINFILSISAYSHSGKIRANNEDNFYIDGTILENGEESFQKNFILDNPNCILAVFDGIGGENAGEIASYTAAEALKNFENVYRHESVNIKEKIQYIKNYIIDTNKIIYLSSEKKDEYNNMGTTFACLVKIDNLISTINIGDSKAFIFRNKSLIQLTKDNTEAERLFRLGIIKKRDIKNHPNKNILSKYLGMPTNYGEIEPEVSKIIKLRNNDIFLLCSDGLTDMVGENEIISNLLNKNNLQNETEIIVTNLMDQALQAGGRDNITIIVAKAYLG